MMMINNVCLLELLSLLERTLPFTELSIIDVHFYYLVKDSLSIKIRIRDFKELIYQKRADEGEIFFPLRLPQQPPPIR